MSNTAAGMLSLVLAGSATANLGARYLMAHYHPLRRGWTRGAAWLAQKSRAIYVIIAACAAFLPIYLGAENSPNFPGKHLISWGFALIAVAIVIMTLIDTYEGIDDGDYDIHQLYVQWVAYASPVCIGSLALAAAVQAM